MHESGGLWVRVRPDLAPEKERKGEMEHAKVYHQKAQLLSVIFVFSFHSKGEIHVDYHNKKQTIQFEGSNPCLCQEVLTHVSLGLCR
jgi:hypothetical protein